MKKTLALGLMSGTSADGLSLALARFQPQSYKLLAYATVAYPQELRKKILSAQHFKTADLSRLNFQLGSFFAQQTQKFIKKTKSAKKIAIIGSHGQTVYHGPDDRPQNTLQIGEPACIALLTHIPVVADFRPSDIAAGGSGAPLIPYFDEFFFATHNGRALQNIGGIANVTFLKKGQNPLAFDNGPGNALMDSAMQRITRGKKSYDRNGLLARQGTILPAILKELQTHRYFAQEPPKSTGRELFNLKILPASLWRHPPADIMATLTYFSAWAMADSYFRFSPFKLHEVLVSGGGAFNSTLMEHLKNLLYPVRVQRLEETGLPSQAKEPLAFAFFAWRALHALPNHSPATTGAKKQVILGKFIHAPH